MYGLEGLEDAHDGCSSSGDAEDFDAETRLASSRCSAARWLTDRDWPVQPGWR